MTADLFDIISDVLPPREEMADGAVLLRGFARPIQHDLLRALDDITVQAPFRHMSTPGGFEMSVAMTNCGNFGWITDRSGYRYDGNDPVSGNVLNFTNTGVTFGADPIKARLDLWQSAWEPGRQTMRKDRE